MLYYISQNYQSGWVTCYMAALILEIIAIGTGTYLFRAGSLSFGSRIAWPLWARKWLSFVTPAVLGALLGPMLLLPNNHFVQPLHNMTLIAAIPTVIVGWFSHYLLATVAIGVICFALLSHWF